MTAFFLGPAGRQLFGYYHTPQGSGSGAVVLCPSWGPDYQYSHRALRVAARRFADRGLHALRFDYSGTGDSWGDSTDASLSRWVEDTRLAMEELKEMSGFSRVDLVGLRVGANTAAAASAGRKDVRKLVLWEPVLDGRTWVRELDLKGTDEAGRPARPIAAGGGATISSAGGQVSNSSTTVEFSSRIVTGSLVTEFAALSPSGFAGTGAGATLLVETIVDEETSLTRLKSEIPGLERLFIEDAQPWREDMSISNGLVPARAIAGITDWLVTG
ncbi:MAG: alpha/beta hydrolase [Gemmatimonadota bacterium]|jgi:pimeloyl-ACP methyl ester carboxylesterase|nr:alpha/beta hydrolase [Gemmatimonadota bacterium]